MSVDTYNSDDWQKLRAAVNALKSPVLDDSVLLESTRFDYVQSHSNPNSDLTEDDVQALKNGNGTAPFGFQSHDNMAEHLDYGPSKTHARRASEGALLNNQDLEVGLGHGDSPYAANSGNSTNDWVAGLPESGRRVRSHTVSSMPLVSVPVRPASTLPYSMTLPNNFALQQAQSGHDANGSSGTKGGLMGVEVADANISLQVSRASQRDSIMSSLSSPSATSDARPDSALLSPSTPLTPSSKLVKIYMSRVQKGTLPER